jgi:general secretion pathway protein J
MKQTSSIQYPASSIQYPASSIQYPASSIQYPASSIQHQASSIQYPASSIKHPAPGFTLLEILIAIFIFAIIITTVFASYRIVFSNTDIINKEITSYEMARNCLNRMTMDLQSVHVFLVPGYTPPDFDDPPDPYRIVGETTDIKGSSFPWLRFTSLAHLPFRKNKHGGIVEIVYYVQGTDDAGFVLKRADNSYPFQDFEEKASDPVLCENVKALTIEYLDQEGEEYDVWDSDDETYEYATPKAVKIKLELETGSEPLLFETMVTLPVIREPIK